MAEYSTKKQDYPKPYEKYASASLTVSGTLVDVKTSTSFFGAVTTGRYLDIKVSSVPINVFLNASTNDAIAFAAGETKTISNLNIQNIYLQTTASGNATVDLFMLGWN